MIEIIARTILAGLILIATILWILTILRFFVKRAQKKRDEQDWGPRG